MSPTPPVTGIDADTLLAYQETLFEVLGASPFTLKIGVISVALVNLYGTHQIDCASFITACNPASQLLDDSTNNERQARMASDLRDAGLLFIDGIGRHPSNEWPGEPSFLVLGHALDSARAMGMEYGQNAIIWCGPDAIPELVLLR